MKNKNGLAEFMEEHGLVLRICDGAITICDGDCEHCGDTDGEIDFDYAAEDM